jgi:hypothetical protein
MRTTLNLDDDVYRAAKRLAQAEQKSIGEVISRLARRALAPNPRISESNEFPVFSVSPEAAPITNEMVKAAIEDDAETRFRARTALGSPEEALRLLDDLDRQATGATISSAD